MFYRLVVDAAKIDEVTDDIVHIHSSDIGVSVAFHCDSLGEAGYFAKSVLPKIRAIVVEVSQTCVSDDSVQEVTPDAQKAHQAMCEAVASAVLPDDNSSILSAADYKITLLRVLHRILRLLEMEAAK